MAQQNARWPSNEPFLNPDGSWTLAWYRWFDRTDKLQTAQILTPGGGEGDGLFAFAASDPSVAESMAALVGGIPLPAQQALSGGDIATAPQRETAFNDFPLFPGTIPGAVTPKLLTGARADRANIPASGFPTGTIYIETDSTLVYYVNSGSWLYLEGIYRRVQSQLAALAAGLGVDDRNLLVSVTDYNHVLRWTGSAWQRGPGDTEHSDTFHWVGAAVAETGWHDCDGSTGVSFLHYDGTLGTRDLPNTNSTAAYPRAASAYSATIVAATLPTLTMNSYTPAGTNSAPTFSGSTFTPAGTVASTFFGSPQGFGTNTFTLNGAGSAALVSPTSITPAGAVGSSFSGSGGTPAGTISAPVFTGTPATLTGTITLPADPVAHFSAVLMYRQ